MGGYFLPPPPCRLTPPSPTHPTLNPHTLPPSHFPKLTPEEGREPVRAKTAARRGDGGSVDAGASV